jgi:hypothetical protein
VNIIDGGTRCMSRRCNVGNLNHLLDHLIDTAKQPPAYRYGSKKPVPRGEWKETGWYEYDDEHGELVYRIVRKEDGHGNKTFDYQRPVGEKGWKTGGTKDIPRVLYRLPELIAADPDDHVFVVEGERLVKRLQKLGLVATTNPGGAGKWRDEHNEYLRGRRVVLLPDNDSPGRDHMEDVARDNGKPSPQPSPQQAEPSTARMARHLELIAAAQHCQEARDAGISCGDDDCPRCKPEPVTP